MIWSYGLTLAAICLVVKAASNAARNIREEIIETNHKTNETLIQVGLVAEAVKKLERTIENSKLAIDARSLNLTNYQTILVYKMYALNVTVTSLEKYIEYDRRLLEELKHLGFRLDFIIKLLREDIHILFERRQNGDEETCYRILRNNIPLQVALALNSINSSKVLDMGSVGLRSGVILIQELNLAKIKLFGAQRELLLEEQIFESKKDYYNILTLTGMKLLKQLAEYITEAEDVVARLERYVQYKKAEEADLYRQLVKEEKKRRPKFDEIKKLQKELAGYKKAISCYTKLENAF